MQVHLVDATYELFRAHFSPRPPVLGREGVVLSGVSGLVEQLCYLLREQGATHVGCATDRVIRSFRNDLYPGYKTEAGMDPELLAQFPVAEAAIEALGLVLWPMVEFEADDAIAAAAERFAADPRVERIVICTPDKDMAQCVRGERVVLWDRRRDLVYDDAGVRAKWGVPPASVADRLALVGDAADGFPGLPGWGDKSASAVLARYGSLEAIPAQRRRLGRAGPARRPRPRGHAARADGRGAPLPRPRPAAHDGRRRADPPGGRRRAPLARARTGTRWTAFCDEWGLARLGRAARTAGWARADRRGRDGEPDAVGPSRDSRSSSGWCAGGAATIPNGRVALSTSNHGPPRASVTIAPAALRDQPGRRDVPRGHAPGLDERVEPAVRDVGERERRGAHVARHADRLAHRAAAGRDRAAAERERDHAVGQLLLVRGVDDRGRRASPARPRSPRRSRRASGRGPRPTAGRPSTTSPTDTQKNGIPFA